MRPGTTPSTGYPDSRCPLVLGSPTCSCADEVPHLTDAELRARASSMLVWYHRADQAGRLAVRRGLDQLLARTDLHPDLLADLLRIAITVVLVPDGAHDTENDAARAAEVDERLDRFSRLAEIGGDTVRVGEAAVFRALRTMRFGFVDHALVDVATALTVLVETADDPSTDLDEPGGADTAGRLGHALNGLVVVLVALGAYELADDVSQRAVTTADRSGTAGDRLYNHLNRVRLQLSWALRLERAGRAAAAATRFVGAARTARIAAGLWAPAVRPHAVDDLSAAVVECPIIGAAIALHQPGPQHLDMLEVLHHTARSDTDRIVLGIAISRCLRGGNRISDAFVLLTDLLDDLGRDRGILRGPEGMLGLALHHEIATLERLLHPVDHGGTAGRRYAAALESEMWASREARLTALRSHVEHHRVVRAHGHELSELSAVAAQALLDPLTGLPNRRALDRRLAELTRSPTGQPCAIALIDLDGFKTVNDARSHAAGDAVLREIAATLRTTLRTGGPHHLGSGQDMVARYGGDEFVVVLPDTPLPVAVAALDRAAEAVAALPHDVAAGVTLSVGVAAASVGHDPAAALAAADAAMYRAKRAGGNVVVGAGLPDAPSTRQLQRPPYLPATRHVRRSG